MKPETVAHVNGDCSSPNAERATLVPSMSRTAPRDGILGGIAGLDFIRAAFCPLDFTGQPLAKHPLFRELRADPALGVLEVGEPLHFARQFRFKDRHGNSKTATQLVTAPFGLAPKDFDLFLGLYTYVKQLPELPTDGCIDLTADFLGRRCGFSTSSQKDYRRIRSRIFRLSFAKYTNSAFWNPETETYDITNFEFYSLAALSRVTATRRPITLQFSRRFLDVVRASKFLRYDESLYHTLSPAMRRLYLIANQLGWRYRDGAIYDADEFAINQIGYRTDPSDATNTAGRKSRLLNLKRLLAEAESRDLIRPCDGWQGYFRMATTGPLRGHTVLRWSRGPSLLIKTAARQTLATSLENDALFDLVRDLRDDDGKPVNPIVFHTWVEKFGRASIQKHVRVVLAQKEQRPGSFDRSEIAALVDRLNHNYTDPDWYIALAHKERLSRFEKVQPNQLSMEMYESFFR